MIMEKPVGLKSEGESTKALHEGGEIRSSEEASVMEVERRGLLLT